MPALIPVELALESAKVQLKELQLTGNDISNLPAELSGLRGLQLLSAHANR